MNEKNITIKNRLRKSKEDTKKTRNEIVGFISEAIQWIIAICVVAGFFMILFQGMKFGLDELFTKYDYKERTKLASVNKMVFDKEDVEKREYKIFISL